MQIRVYYDDTDAGGIVYHANYLKFCERARSESFFQRGVPVSVNGAHFVVKHIEADFIRSAKLGDLLEVKHEIITLKNASLTLKQNVWLDDVKLFEMTSVLAYVRNGRPVKIEPEAKEFFLSIF